PGRAEAGQEGTEGQGHRPGALPGDEGRREATGRRAAGHPLIVLVLVATEPEGSRYPSPAPERGISPNGLPPEHGPDQDRPGAGAEAPSRSYPSRHRAIDDRPADRTGQCRLRSVQSRPSPGSAAHSSSRVGSRLHRPATSITPGGSRSRG